MKTMAQRMKLMTPARVALLVLLTFASVTSAWAEGYQHHHPHTPTPNKPSTSSSSAKTYNYRVGYRNGSGGFGWARNYGSRDSSSGYTGANTSVNRPHRSDWYAKLNAQRQWDDAQYKKSQQASNARCGFTGAPAYCYRLMGPYPQELRVVRY